VTFEQRQYLRRAIDRARRAEIGSIGKLERRYSDVEHLLVQIHGRDGTEIDMISTRPIHKRAWTAVTIIEAIQRWTREYGTPPRNYDWKFGGVAARDYHYPHSSTVVKTFGRWNVALAAAGLAVREPLALAVVSVREGELRCSSCQTWKADEAFVLGGPEHRRGRRYYCRACDNAQRRARQRRESVAA
jgi:hypothetical protein